MALLLTLVLAARVLVAPIHLWQERVAGQSAPAHDPLNHSTDHHASDSCSVCQDLLLTQHVGPGVALAAPLAERVDLPLVQIPESRVHGVLALPTGGARGPPRA